MNNQKHFIAAANAVIQMYELRQHRPRFLANSPAEIDCACCELINVASAAAYAGSEEATVIKAAADYWKQTGNKPDSILQ